MTTSEILDARYEEMLGFIVETANEFEAAKAAGDAALAAEKWAEMLDCEAEARRILESMDLDG